MTGLFSSSPCPWQNSLQSQWEQGYPAKISVTNGASLKSVFWHWRESFITMHHCKLYQGGSSSLPSSLSVSSSNIAADRHTRDMAGKQWEMLFHWQPVTRWVCICFCLLPMKYYWPECAIKERNRQLWNQKTYCRNCKAIWRIRLFCPCEMGHQASCAAIWISLPSFPEGGWLLGRSFAGIAESYSLTGASWWVFPSAVLLQLTSAPAESPSAFCWRVIPSDTSHSTDQTEDQKPASWGNNT